jgi:hypothetical protein
MNQITTAVVTVLTAIVGVAILAVLVSKNSNTTGVLQAGGTSFASALNAALSPVTGSSGFSQFGGVGGGGY